MTRFFVLAFAVVVMLLTQSCTTDTRETGSLTGTVVFLSFEGGFYGIKGDDGQNYDPTNLPEDLQKDGLRVRFEIKPITNRASFHMWGVIIELVHIHKL